MAVPTVITDLNVSAGSNSPGDTEQVFPDNDNFLRAIQAFIRRPQAKGTSLASSTTVSIGGSTDGDFMDITHSTGTTAISSFGTVAAGIVRIVRFVVTGGTLTITHNATSMILPSGQNITVTNNDMAAFRSLGSGNWICENYLGANGYFANLALSSTSAIPLSVSTNYAGAAGVNITNSNAGNYAMSLHVIAAGTGSAYIQAYNNTTDFLGYISWADDASFALNAGGGTAYSISTSRAHDFTVGASQNYTITFNSGDYIVFNNDGTNSYGYASGATFFFGTNTANSFVVTTNSVTRHSYLSTGEQKVDGPNQPGVLEPVFYPRVIARNTNGNTAIAQAGSTVTISCTRPATGQYDYTVSGRSGSTTIYASGNPETAGYTMAISSPTATTFTVNISDGLGVAYNSAHTLILHWG